MSNLYVALKSLLETCDAHRHVFQVPDFRGMEVVFRKDPSELHKGITSTAVQFNNVR